MVKIVTQLGKSKKYANGSVHENASGTFQIIDRYLSSEGIVMLKVEWLTGEKAGQQEENREENINASIYKYEQSRGLLGTIIENKEVVTMKDLQAELNEVKEELKLVRGILLEHVEIDKTIKNVNSNLEKALQAQSNIMVDVVKQLSNNTKKIEEILEDGEKRDDNIKDLANTVDKNTNLIQTITSNLDIFQNQQRMMDKLLEKI